MDAPRPELDKEQHVVAAEHDGAQHEDLGILGTISATTQHQQVDHEADKSVEAGHLPSLAAPEPHCTAERETPGQPLRMSFRPPRGRAVG